MSMQTSIAIAMARRIKARPEGKNGSWVAEDSAAVMASQAIRDELAKLTEAEALEALVGAPFVFNASQAAQWLAKNNLIIRPKRGSKSDPNASATLDALKAELNS